MASLKAIGRFVTTAKILVVGWTILAASYFVLDHVGEWNHARQGRLRAARRVAAAISSREAATGHLVRTAAELGTPSCTTGDECLFPSTDFLGALNEIELKAEPRRACVGGTCSEVNPRERCVGQLCARVELAPLPPGRALDANLPTPGLEDCEASVAQTLETERCVELLSSTCSTSPTAFEVVVDAELRLAMGGVGKPCRAQTRTTDGKFIISYWAPRGFAWERGVEVLAGVTVLSARPDEVATVMCGGCRAEVQSSTDAGWALVWDMR